MASLKDIASTADIAMNAVSEAMATILTLATAGKHSEIIISFIEALGVMSANKEESKVSSKTLATSLSSNMASSSEIWGIEEKPEPILGQNLFPKFTVAVATKPLSSMGQCLAVLEQQGLGRVGHHLLQTGQAHAQVPHGGADYKVNRLKNILEKLFPWKRK